MSKIKKIMSMGVAVCLLSLPLRLPAKLFDCSYCEAKSSRGDQHKKKGNKGLITKLFNGISKILNVLADIGRKMEADGILLNNQLHLPKEPLVASLGVSYALLADTQQGKTPETYPELVAELLKAYETLKEAAYHSVLEIEELLDGDVLSGSGQSVIPFEALEFTTNELISIKEGIVKFDQEIKSSGLVSPENENKVSAFSLMRLQQVAEGIEADISSIQSNSIAVCKIPYDDIFSENESVSSLEEANLRAELLNLREALQAMINEESR